MRYLLSVLFILLAFPVLAQNPPNCKPRNDMEGFLTTFGEERVAVGVSDDSGLVEIWRNKKTGTFTITGTALNGMTCIFSAGRGWEENIKIDGPHV